MARRGRHDSLGPAARSVHRRHDSGPPFELSVDGSDDGRGQRSLMAHEPEPEPEPESQPEPQPEPASPSAFFSYRKPEYSAFVASMGGHMVPPENRTVSDVLEGPIFTAMNAAYDVWRAKENGGEDEAPGERRFFEGYSAGLPPEERAALAAAVQELEEPTAFYETQWIEWQRCPVRDARALPLALDLSSCGFLLQPHVSGVADWSDDAAVAAEYYPELAGLVADVAQVDFRRVFVEQHTIREEEGEEEGAQEAGAAETDPQSPPQQPIQLVHNDFSGNYKDELLGCFRGESSTTLFHSWEHIAAKSGLSLSELQASRVVMLNAWRNIADQPVTRMPLAVCDQRTVSPEDLIPTRLGTNALEIFMSQFSARHRWFHFSQMTRDEVLLIKTYDSALGPGQCPTLHSACDLPPAGGSGSPRRSCEARVLLILSQLAGSARL